MLPRSNLAYGGIVVKLSCTFLSATILISAIHNTAVADTELSIMVTGTISSSPSFSIANLNQETQTQGTLFISDTELKQKYKNHFKGTTSVYIKQLNSIKTITITY
jgi:hypothetical protein